MTDEFIFKIVHLYHQTRKKEEKEKSKQSNEVIKLNNHP